MGSIGRYIFRTAFGAFVLVLVSLTITIWMTQALRDLDLVTSQGQSVLTFVGITGLIIPLLVLIIAPIALVISVSHVLQKLSTDSEIIVMNGAGMQPWRLFRPLVAVTVVVTLMLVLDSAYFAPKGLRVLRDKIVEVRTDLITNIVQPGRFMSIEQGLAFHIRERRPNGLLVGILLDDRRDPKERVTILAEQGEILKNDRGMYLILEHGSIQRLEPKSRDPNIVRFERYAFDLSRFATSPMVVQYSVRERYLWQLISPDPADPLYKQQRNQFWAELNDRIIGLLYPAVFTVIAFAFLGAPRTTRQSTTWSIVAVIACVGLVRLLGFACTIVSISIPSIVAVQYLLVAGVIYAGLHAISKALIIEPPAKVLGLIDVATQWFQRRANAFMGQPQ